MKDVTVKIPATVEGQTIANLLFEAFAHSEWLKIPKETKAIIDKYREGDMTTGDAVWRAVSDREQLKFTSDLGDEGLVTEFSVVRAMQKISDEDIELFDRIISEQSDAEDADHFMQYVLFEELLFG